MKKFILLLMCMVLSIGASMAKTPKVIVDNPTGVGVKVVNDSTIIYYDAYKIIVNEPSNVYTAIFKLPTSTEAKKGKLPTLMIMSFGSYTFTAPDEGNYILYASKSFDRILYRQTDYMEYY